MASDDHDEFDDEDSPPPDKWEEFRYEFHRGACRRVGRKICKAIRQLSRCEAALAKKEVRFDPRLNGKPLSDNRIYQTSQPAKPKLELAI